MNDIWSPQIATHIYHVKEFHNIPERRPTCWSSISSCQWYQESKLHMRKGTRVHAAHWLYFVPGSISTPTPNMKPIKPKTHRKNAQQKTQGPKTWRCSIMMTQSQIASLWHSALGCFRFMLIQPQLQETVKKICLRYKNLNSQVLRLGGNI
jgi:hypothetical protein